VRDSQAQLALLLPNSQRDLVITSHSFYRAEPTKQIGTDCGQ